MVGIIGHITQHTDRLTFDLTDAYYRGFCEYEGIKCEIKGNNLDREIHLYHHLKTEI
jgi:hypothetical protein